MTGENVFDTNERSERMDDVKVEVIAPNGLGYGEGPISVEKRLESGALDEETIAKTEQASLSPKANIRISKVKYDTCIDGRCATCIQRLEGSSVIEESDPTFCYKVAGGGVTMGAIGDIATRRDRQGGVKARFKSAIQLLKEKGIGFGVHSSNHGNTEKSDCGAIDKAPLILMNSVKYRFQILSTLEALFGEYAFTDQFKKDYDSVYENFDSFLNSDGFKNENYCGADVVGVVAQEGYPVKVLADDHLEIRIRINVDVDNFTTNQAYIRGQTGDRAQVFGVDIPRMKEIADLGWQDLADKRKAFLGMIIYNLATATTLTDGSLPVDKVYKKYANPKPIFKSQKLALVA